MTELQEKLYKAINKLDEEIDIYNYHHRLAKRKKQNVIVPLQNEVKNLLIQVHGERKSNYKITSE